MEIVLLGKSEKDLKDWKQAGNAVVLKKIRRLIEAIQQNPFQGIGKPEPLKHNLAGKWPRRRITEEDRIVYEVDDENIKIYSLKGHYKNPN